MNVQDRVKKAHVAIMRHPKFCLYSGVLATGKVRFTDEIPSACTDGWNVLYNPSFITANMSTEPELRFLVLHEATHKSFRHTTLWRHLAEENAALANIAMDLFVNLALQDADANEGFIKMPANGVQPDPKYRGWSVQMIYDDLKKNGNGGQGGDGEGQGFDEHDFSGSGDDGKPVDAATEQARANAIQRALRQGEIIRRKMAGKGASGMDGVLGDLLTPKVDWRKLLREFVTETCSGRDESTWRKPNRRFLADDVYMPSMIGTTITRLVIGFDTSGSVFNSPEMARFVTEIKAIAEAVKPRYIDVVYWDTAVAGHQTFEDGQFAVQNLKPKGGGGTDGSVLFDYLRDKRIRPDAIVQFTDGYVGEWGNTDVPTLWAITTDSISAPFGTTVHIAD